MKLLHKILKRFNLCKSKCCEDECETIIITALEECEVNVEVQENESAVDGNPEEALQDEETEPILLDKPQPEQELEIKDKDNQEQTHVKREALCFVEGCRNKATRKGMCNKHYLEYYKRVVEPTKPLCIIDGCEGHSRTRGLCKRHYEFLQKRGVFKKFPDGLKPEIISEIYHEYTKNS